MLEKTKEVITVYCGNCGTEINITTYRNQYIKDLIDYSKKAHNALKTVIDSNKVAASLKIYYPNGEYETIGNIRAEAPHKY
jgi:hypothetical protein